MISKSEVVVIGGGAAGLMAAISAAKAGASVCLLEKNERLGEKVRISGGGRCNIFNAEEDPRLLLENYGSNSKYLHSAFSAFGVEETRTFFEQLGLKIKVEDRNRAFPASNDANQVVDVLEAEANKLGVTFLKKTEVTQVDTKDGIISALQTTEGEIQAASVILATGGLSRPETGSTGEGLEWLSKLGHEIAEPTPNITPIGCKEEYVKLASGTTLRNIKLKFSVANTPTLKLSGDVLFTHFGFSGPLILNNASKVAELLYSSEVRLLIDCFPKLSIQQLDESITNVLKEHPAKQTRNILKYFCPDGTVALVAAVLGGHVNLDVKTSEFSKHNRLILVNLLKALPFTIDRLMGFERAVVADGGVSLEELNMRTMQSLKIPNLYIVGDLLNINRPSGGFSLQLCWTTGYVAGKSAASV